MTEKQQKTQLTSLVVSGFWSISRPISLFCLAVIVAIYMHWSGWLFATIAILDVRARLSDFIRFRKFSYNKRLFALLEKSWCKRGVAEAIWPEAAVFYRANGHKIYHILPVGAPRIFFKLRFWEAVLGTEKPKNHTHW